MAISDAFAQTQWFRLLVGVLAQTGVRHVIVSPGSRSTPLVCAVERQAGLHVTSCIDERQAAFIALGLARVTGEPCALVCTSGTAPAHYYPAVIEAKHSAIPLIIISADRPAEFHGNGSSQTTDQARLFGQHVRGFFDLGTPEARPSALSGLVRKVAQGVGLSRGPHPGPVHFNAQAFKPLEPVLSSNADEVAHEARVDALRQQPSHHFHAGIATPSAATASMLTQRWADACRPVLLCGPSACYAPCSALSEFARRTHWPVLAEITHPLRQTRATQGVALIEDFELVARAAPQGLTPDLVVCVGAAPTSSAWLNWLAQCNASIDVLAPHELVDPLNRANNVAQCDAEAVFEAVNHRLPQVVSAERTAQWLVWGETWQNASTDAKRRVEAYLTNEPSPERPTGEASFTEAHVIADAAKAVRENDVVTLGNSLPIRVAETFFRPKVPYVCVSQRGVSGIDGLVAGAVGAYLGTGRRGWLILGDVSAVHDLSSLRLLRAHDANVVVLIVDNDGGRIFDSLPVAKHLTDLNAWTTPHHTAFDAVASALGVPAVQVTTREQLCQTLARVPEKGPLVVWARVAADGAQVAYRELTAPTTRVTA